MNQLITAGNTQQLTMSSREIAELTGKRHPDVKRDIEVMLKALERDVSSFAHTYFDSMNRKQAEYRLDRELTETLVTGYSIPLRHRVIKRLHELEQRKAAPGWLENLSPQAKVVIEDLNSQVNHYRQETDRLNAVCNDLAENLKAGLTPVEFCRMLNGVNLNRVQAVLVERKRLLKTQHGYRSAAAYRDKLFTERRYLNKEDRPCEKVILTQKGAKWLYSQYEQGQLEMRKDWDGNYTHMLFDNEEKAA
ncbi:Rha family transcriptional regulator [Marinobacter adhaerens]|nr:Rha family transcriptional regulator [Marinobacter adhaerens]QWV14437.1 Rha family transcriptional regulator [Marinobacter adhaerens]